jgi:uncharacterized protein YndB with AHSA1/START domain
VNTDCVTVSTMVAVDPATAFAVFTNEIETWWRPKVPGLFQRGCNGTLKFDNGRLLEIYSQGEPFEIGRVLAWEPAKRLVVQWRQEGFVPGERTEVEVRFEAAGGGTRVTIEHRGWDALAADHPARHGFTGDAFTSMIGLRWADALTALRYASREPLARPELRE